MYSQTKKRLNVPENLEKFLIELTVEILIHNPTDLNEFCYRYFKNIFDQKLVDSNVSTDAEIPEKISSKGSLVSNHDESVDELQELDWFDNKNAQSRRCSVFNKAYDPDSESEPELINLAFNLSDDISCEVLENRRFESNNVTKSAEQKEKLKDVLRSIFIFKYLYDDELQEIVEEMFMRTTEPGETIIRQGDDGYYFYVIFDGVYEIFVQNESNGEENNSDLRTKYGVYKNGGFFGELSLLYDQVRKTTFINVFFYNRG